MTKQELVRAAMMDALKNKDRTAKDTLSMLLAALKNAEIDKRSELSEAECDAVVQKEIKCVNETLESCPAERQDVVEECHTKLKILEQFAPKLLSQEEITVIIKDTLTELSLSSPTKKDKGKIMKGLMPKVKGKADGKLVNQLLDAHLL